MTRVIRKRVICLLMAFSYEIGPTNSRSHIRKLPFRSHSSETAVEYARCLDHDLDIEKMGHLGTRLSKIPFLRRKQLQTLPTLDEHIKLSNSLFVCQVARKQWWPGKTAALWQASHREDTKRAGSRSILIKWIIQTGFTLRFTDIESLTLQDKVQSFPSDVCFDVLASHLISDTFVSLLFRNVTDDTIENYKSL